MQKTHIENISTKLKSIAHPIRLKILCILLDGEKSVGEIHRYFTSTYSNISQHLQKLQNLGVVTSEKRANYMYYSTTDEKMDALIRVLKTLYCQEE